MPQRYKVLEYDAASCYSYTLENDLNAWADYKLVCMNTLIGRVFVVLEYQGS